MAYSARCDTAAATKWWYTGTGTAENTLSEIMDDNPAGVEENDNPGSYQSWSTFMTEDVDNGAYRIHLDLESGDGSITTNLELLNQTIWFDDGVSWTIKSASTVSLGEVVDSWGRNGCHISLSGPADSNHSLLNGVTATLNIYGSHLHSRSRTQQQFNTGTLKIKNSILSAEYSTDSYFKRKFVIQSAISTLEMEDVFITDVQAFSTQVNPDTFSGVWVHNCLVGFGVWMGASDVDIVGLKVTGNSGNDIQYQNAAGTGKLNIIEPEFTISNVSISSANGEINEKYYCDAKTKRAGVDLQSVAVEMLDKDGNTTGGFTSVDTDANGEIAQQTYIYQKWSGTGETNTIYYPHSVQCSKAGLETRNTTGIDRRQSLDLLMEMWDSYVAASNVKDTIQYGPYSTDYTGTLESTDPGEANVKKDVGYIIESANKTGTLQSTDPGSQNVRDGVAYIIESVSKEGTLGFLQLANVAITKNSINIAISVDDYSIGVQG